jgi:hypothetical protein
MQQFDIIIAVEWSSLDISAMCNQHNSNLEYNCRNKKSIKICRGNLYRGQVYTQSNFQVKKTLLDIQKAVGTNKLIGLFHRWTRTRHEKLLSASIQQILCNEVRKTCLPVLTSNSDHERRLSCLVNGINVSALLSEQLTQLNICSTCSSMQGRAAQLKRSSGDSRV